MVRRSVNLRLLHPNSEFKVARAQHGVTAYDGGVTDHNDVCETRKRASLCASLRVLAHLQSDPTCFAHLHAMVRIITFRIFLRLFSRRSYAYVHEMAIFASICSPTRTLQNSSRR